MRLDDKIALLEGAQFWQTHPAPALGLRALWLSDGPHGVRKARAAGASGIGDAVPATCFPTASALAATWDPALVEEVGCALGREARALGVDVLLGPGLNLKRSPLGGRSFEYFSEDPLLAGRLAGAMVRGIQSAGAAACVKHFAVNNQEDHRMVVDALVDERTLRELYLRAFEIAVTEGRPFTVMGAYNRVNGVYACENRVLIEEILRGEWGFDGVVLSDWGAVDDGVAALQGGLDLAMPGTNGALTRLIQRAAKSGAIDEARVDQSVARLVALAERIGEARPMKAADWDAHHALARRAAAAGCVLLSNDAGVLPLPTPAGRIAVIGALAKRPRYQGAGSSGVVPTRVVGIYDALVARAGVRCTHAEGYRLDDAPDAALVAEAVALARGADVVIVVAGLPTTHESESFDRAHLRLPRGQDVLIEAVAAACPRVVVVLCNGAPVEMPWADRASAIVEAYLGGQAGGEGVVDVLLGDVNPSGKLAETFAIKLEDHASTAFFPGDAQHVQYREGLYVGYRWFDSAEVAVRFPFGHGLSYTTFELAELEVQQDADEVVVSFTVANTGARAGAEVVQIYVHDVEHVVIRPEQELVAFERVELAAGARERRSVRLDRRSFAFWDVHRHRWAVEAGAFEIRAGVSSRDIRMRTRIDVASNDGPFEPDAPGTWAQAVHPFRPTTEDFVALLGRPLPARRPALPITRETTIGQARATQLGRLFYRVARASARRQLENGDDPSLASFAEAMVTDLPLRGLVTLSGMMSWRQLDALVDLLNGRVGDSLRRLWRRR